MRNERGITLIELLAVITLFSLIAIAVTSITVQGLNNNEKIKQELILRDEAEILLTTAVKSIYTTLESDVVKYENNMLYTKVPKGDVAIDAQPSLVKCENMICEVATGFITANNETTFFVESVEVPISNQYVTLSNQSKIEPVHTITNSVAPTEPNTNGTTTQVPTYKIKLGLINNTKSSNKTVWFENEITTINNK